VPGLRARRELDPLDDGAQGGIDAAELSSKSMEAKRAPGLYAIGEVVDLTGWLGGYNFQWAWPGTNS
jgi:predicted flavoprotein YhiN